MSPVDKNSNFLDDKKEEVVMAPMLEKKLFITENFTTVDEVLKRTEKFTTSEEVVKGTYKVQKRTENITANEYVDK